MPQESITNRYMTKLGLPPQQVTWDGSLSFDEVAKFFSVPIAEASTILGVCSSVLKKICRENGLPRWPYRKFLAGKTVEEIKSEAIREKEAGEEQARASNDNEKHAHSTDSPAVGTPSTEVLSRPSNEELVNNNESNVNDPNKGQHGASSTALVHSGVNRSTQGSKQTTQVRISVPTYLDEFKQGFPCNGLSMVSHRWWGCDDSTERTNEAEHQEQAKAIEPENKLCKLQGSEGVLLNEHVDKSCSVLCSPEKEEKISVDQNVTIAPNKKVLNDKDLSSISMITRMRKREVEKGRKALRLAVSHGYGPYKLKKKQILLLQKLFGPSLS